MRGVPSPWGEGAVMFPPVEGEGDGWGEALGDLPIFLRFAQFAAARAQSISPLEVVADDRWEGVPPCCPARGVWLRAAGVRGVAPGQGMPEPLGVW